MGSVFWSGKPLRLGRAPDLGAVVGFCAGARVRGVERRGKYILVFLSGGKAGQGCLLVHLGMSGRLLLAPVAAPRAAHTHLAWTLPGGRELRFVDPRRFGWVAAAAEPARLPELSRLGPDPLTELDAASFAEALARSLAPVKAFLLDQKRVGGLGNIYVCEALYRAGVHPQLPARRVRTRAARLLEEIQAVLRAGIANRGTTLRDYVDADGAGGRNQNALWAYGREGKSCVRCARVILRRTDAGRSTFFCPGCQRR